MKGQAALEHILIFAGILIFSVIVSILIFRTAQPPQEISIVTYDKYRASLKGVELVGYDEPYDGTPQTAPEKVVYKGDEYEPELVAEGNASGEEIVEIGTKPSGGGFGVYYYTGGGGSGIQLEAVCPTLSISGLSADVLSRKGIKRCLRPQTGQCYYTDQYVSLSWNPVVTDIGGCFSYYRILMDGSKVGETTSTTFEHNPGSGTHTYRVEAIDSKGSAVAYSEKTVEISDGTCICPIIPSPRPPYQQL
ncbi:MAG: hypothetical protein J7K68_00695 [Candidatus Diapherotrites archaeon]|nr:hypothetical protein [Candidatus Diapherotrites archaeon]